MDWVALYEDWDAEELGEGEGERKVVFDEWCSRVQKLEPSADEECPTLLELCCRVAGRALPFQLVQEAPSPFDRDVQRRVAYWSFPSCYSDIRRYIELNSGSPEAARAMYQSAASLSLASHVQIGESRDCMCLITPATIYNYHVLNNFCQLSFGGEFVLCFLIGWL